MDINAQGAAYWSQLSPSQQQALATDLGYQNPANAQFALMAGDPKAMAAAQAAIARNAPASATGAGGAAAMPGTADGLGYYGNPITTYGIPGGGQGTQSGASTMATTTAGQFPMAMFSGAGASDPANIAEWQKWYGANVGKTIMVNGQPRTINQDINPGELFNAFSSNAVGYGQIPGAQAPTPTVGGAGQLQPEQVALGQMAQTDPTSEALRQGLAQSYLSTLQNTPAPTFTPGAAPAASDIQGYLNLYKQIDPAGYAQHVALGEDMNTLVARAQQQMALGSTLDPSTAREVDQATREAQVARGNVYGTPQLVQEAMTRGTAGLALQQQRLQNLTGALGQQQGYLSSGQTLGDIANTLYGQGWQRNMATYQQQLAARQAAQSQALGYLGSGQTPYQAGASYLNTAEQRAANAAAGGPAYNPQGPGGYYTGAGTPSFPQYGLDMSQLANQWGQSMNYANLSAYGMTPQRGNQAGKAATGALSGAASGALAGSAIPGVGTLIGAGVGALAGGAGGYFS